MEPRSVDKFELILQENYKVMVYSRDGECLWIYVVHGGYNSANSLKEEYYIWCEKYFIKNIIYSHKIRYGVRIIIWIEK